MVQTGPLFLLPLLGLEPMELEQPAKQALELVMPESGTEALRSLCPRRQHGEWEVDVLSLANCSDFISSAIGHRAFCSIGAVNTNIWY